MDTSTLHSETCVLTGKAKPLPTARVKSSRVVHTRYDSVVEVVDNFGGHWLKELFHGGHEKSAKQLNDIILNQGCIYTSNYGWSYQPGESEMSYSSGGRLLIKVPTLDLVQDEDESVIYVESTDGRLWSLTIDHCEHTKAGEAIVDILKAKGSIDPGVAWECL